jgi:hypothetical protein
MRPFFLPFQKRQIGPAKIVNRKRSQPREVSRVKAGHIYIPFECNSAGLPKTLEGFMVGQNRSPGQLGTDIANRVVYVLLHAPTASVYRAILSPFSLIDIHRCVASFNPPLRETPRRTLRVGRVANLVVHLRPIVNRPFGRSAGCGRSRECGRLPRQGAGLSVPRHPWVIPRRLPC